LIHEVQQQDNWCWVACFQMACSYFSKQTASQCELAENFLGLTNCCPPGANPACNKTLAEESIPPLYSSIGLIATVTPSPSDSAFQRAISQKLLILLMLQFPSAFHFVLVSRVDPTRGYIVDDPRYSGQFFADFDQLSSAYGQGNIARAWTVGSGKLSSLRQA
jgi:Papain-like cysteine protease AvrRpt2